MIASALFGNAQASITNLVAGTFSGLTMEWENTDTTSVISSTPITPTITNLGTTFIDPDSLNQTLRIFWTDSLDGAGSCPSLLETSLLFHWCTPPFYYS